MRRIGLQEALVRCADEGWAGEMEYSREHFADTLGKVGFADAAEEARRFLPDPVDTEQIAAFLTPYGITLDEITSRLGGSP